MIETETAISLILEQKKSELAGKHILSRPISANQEESSISFKAQKRPGPL